MNKSVNSVSEIEQLFNVDVDYIDTKDIDFYHNERQIYRIYRARAKDGTLVSFGAFNISELLDDLEFKSDGLFDDTFEANVLVKANDYYYDGLLELGTSHYISLGHTVLAKRSVNWSIFAGYVRVTNCKYKADLPSFQHEYFYKFAIRLMSLLDKNQSLLNAYNEFIDKKEENEPMNQSTTNKPNWDLNQFAGSASIYNVSNEPDTNISVSVPKLSIKDKMKLALRRKEVKYAGAVALASGVIYGYKKALHPHVAPVVKSIKDETVRQVNELKDKAIAAIVESTSIVEDSNEDI